MMTFLGAACLVLALFVLGLAGQAKEIDPQDEVTLGDVGIPVHWWIVIAVLVVAGQLLLAIGHRKKEPSQPR